MPATVILVRWSSYIFVPKIVLRFVCDSVKFPINSFIFSGWHEHLRWWMERKEISGKKAVRRELSWKPRDSFKRQRKYMGHMLFYLMQRIFCNLVSRNKIIKGGTVSEGMSSPPPPLSSSSLLDSLLSSIFLHSFNK